MLFKLLMSTALTLNPIALAQSNVQRPDTIETINAEKNYVRNPSANKNASGVSTSSAAVARDTTAGNRIDGVASFTCDTSANNGYCEWATTTIQRPDDIGTCEASMWVKGDSTLYAMQLTDGSSVLATVATPGNVTNYTKMTAVYPCGSTRTIRFTQTTAGTAPAVNIGRVYYGPATTISAATPVTDWQAYTPIFTGFGTPTSVQFYWRRVGADLQVRGTFTTGINTATEARISFPAGLVSSSAIGTLEPAGPPSKRNANSSSFYFIQPMREASVSYFTFAAQQATTNNATKLNGSSLYSTGDLASIEASVPIAGWSGSQTAFRTDTLAWRVDANISGANISLGTASVSSYAGPSNPSLTLINNSGSGTIAAQIACDSTTAPSGTTCSVANEAPGIAFNLPAAGEVLACASFSYSAVTSAASSIATAFQLVETPANAQTILQEGKSRVNAYVQASTTLEVPFRLCGNFSFSSAGQKTLRLFYEQATTGTVTQSVIVADANAGIGQRDVHFEVYPITQSMPVPLLVGSVTSNTPSIERVERIKFGGATANSICTASPCTIRSQSGAWVTSVTRSTAGQYSLSIPAGLFSTDPTCTCTATQYGTSAKIGCNPYNVTATSVALLETWNTAGTGVDAEVQLVCMGPR